MRVMLTNPEGSNEVLLVEKASIMSSGDVIRLTYTSGILIDVYVATNFTAISKMDSLLENGYVNLAGYYADYKKLE